jgi:uncharacterized protein
MKILVRSSVKRWLPVVLVLAFAGMNAVAFFHAYKFTHFSTNVVKTKSPEKLSATDKLKTLLFGVNNPRPANRVTPNRRFTTVTLQSNKKIACWYIPVDSAIISKGTVVLFHGYSGDKSTMLDKADEFLNMGYNTLLVDFMGSGGSEGVQTTVGFQEAAEVKTAYDYLAAQGQQNIYLFGTSMGAAAVLKAVNEYQLSPKAIIVECPFGTMYETVCARFSIMHVPSFPMAGLLLFWGGVQGGFWGFGHNPSEYAKGVQCPALLIYGEQDRNVSRRETDAIYSNLAGPKRLMLLKTAGHENYLLRSRDEWVAGVSCFLQGI